MDVPIATKEAAYKNMTLFLLTAKAIYLNICNRKAMSEDDSMKTLPAGPWHERHAKMGAYGAWRMPLWYEGVTPEHRAVREGVGVFDVSHMGEIFVSGKDALAFLQWTTTNDIAKPPPVSGTYTLVLNERGAIKDETLVYNMGSQTYMMVCDAVAVEKIEAHLRTVLATMRLFGAPDVSIENRTDALCLYSVQGPRAADVCNDLLGIDLGDMWWFQAREHDYGGTPLVVSKSGYTGENGFEIFFDHTYGGGSHAERLWEDIMKTGAPYGIQPCGLGARDSLRIEAGYTLYGEDTKELMALSAPVDRVTPLEAGLTFAVDMEKAFIGRDALLAQEEQGIPTTLVHLVLDDPVIPREGDTLYAEDRAVGAVTSGTKSPLIHKAIAMGYVESGAADEELHVEVRGRRLACRRVAPPFYNHKLYGAYRE